MAEGETLMRFERAARQAPPGGPNSFRGSHSHGTEAKRPGFEARSFDVNPPLAV
jgi:hypothetical protein